MSDALITVNSIEDPLASEEVLVNLPHSGDLVRIKFGDGLGLLAIQWGELITAARRNNQTRLEIIDAAAYIGMSVLLEYEFDTGKAIEFHRNDVLAGKAIRATKAA
jgi:hypothetical protein